MRPTDWLAWYEQHADTYAQVTQASGPVAARDAFMAMLEPGARVVDVGCGAGRDLSAFRAAGFEACGVDASPRLATHAEAHSGATVHVGRFESWVRDHAGSFDGVWACGLLVHTPCSALEGAFASLREALKERGVLWASVRVGQEGEPDDRGRYACTGPAVRAAAEAAGLSVIRSERHADGLTGADETGRTDWWELWAERGRGAR